MLQIALLKLLENRYDPEMVKSAYQEVITSTPKNIDETLKAHMDKLNDLIDNYSQDQGYDLRNLISYHILPLI